MKIGAETALPRALVGWLATLFVGPTLMIAAVAAQVVLAPPWTMHTGAFYWALGAVGLPVLIAGRVTRKIRGWRWLGAVAALGILLIILTALLGPVIVELGNCRAEPAAAGVRRYVCEYRTYQQSVIEYVIEGPEGWPLARIVEIRR